MLELVAGVRGDQMAARGTATMNGDVRWLWMVAGQLRESVDRTNRLQTDLLFARDEASTPHPLLLAHPFTFLTTWAVFVY